MMWFSIFDTETTGLPNHPDAPLQTQPRIIEFGGLITDGVNILDTLEFICNPGIVIEEVITKITGLKNEDLADKPPFSTFIPQLHSFFARTRARMAHNLFFDRSMLQFDCERNGLTLDDISYWDGDTVGHQYAMTAIELCTIEQIMPKYGRHVKLQDWYTMIFGKYEQKHRALDDVKLMFECAKKEGIFEALNSMEKEQNV